VTPLVSVITPTYNHARYLPACLESVLAQRYPRWEQIVIDDGSDDDTEAIVVGYRDERIHYIRQARRGLWEIAHTYNRALAAARGSLIAIIEGDDLWTATKLSELVPLFEDDRVVLAYGRTRVLLPGDGIGRLVPDDATVRRLGHAALTNDPLGASARSILHARLLLLPCAQVIRRASLEAIGGFQHVDGLGATDVPTQLRLALTGRFAYSDALVAYWRRHPAAASLRNEHAIVSRACSYAMEFAERHRDELGLLAADLRAVERSLRRRKDRSALGTARALLVRGEWRPGRERLRVALRSSDVRIAAIALVAYLASWLHRDIESIAGLAGRLDMRRLADARPAPAHAAGPRRN
jgi:glycosyltransferase involved in cell wall biosynthesis